MKLLFLHGFGSDPNGIRPTLLKRSGYEVVHPALPDDDFAESVRIAQEAFDRAAPDVVIGSSRGGAVALSMDTRDVPLILIAPAWRKWAAGLKAKPGTQILHSAHDDVVPLADSRELVRDSSLPDDCLIVAGRDHRMVDPSAFGALREMIGRIGKR